MLLRPILQRESVAGPQVVEGEGTVGGVIVGIVVMQQRLYLLGDGMREGDAARVSLQQGLELVGEKVYLKGDLVSAYYGIPGLKAPSDYQF